MFFIKNFSLITKDELKSKNKIIEKQKDNQIDSLDINNPEEINNYSSSSMDLYFFNKSNNKPEKIDGINSLLDFSEYKNKSQYIVKYSNKNDNFRRQKRKDISNYFSKL